MVPLGTVTEYFTLASGGDGDGGAAINPATSLSKFGASV